MSQDLETCQYCGKVGEHSADCPTQFKAEDNKETVEKTEDKSYERMQELITELGAKSRFSREIAGNEIILTTETGEKYKIERMENKGEEENKRVAKEIRKFNLKFFEKEEVDCVADFAEAIESHLSDFFVVRDEKGKIISLMNDQLVDLSPGKEGQKQDSSLLIWYVVTEEKQRGKGLATELYRAAYETALEQAREKDAGLSAIIGETDPDVEKYLNNLGRKRMYYEKENGDFVEVPYKAPPSAADEEPSPEHFMARFLDGRQEITKEDYLRQVKGIYDQYTRPEYFEYEPEEVKQKFLPLVEKTFGSLEKKLAESKDGKIYLLSAEERQAKKKELAKDKKKLREMKA